MPNAIAGEGDSQGYSFTINASADEIQQFYERELAALGWKVFASGQGTTSAILLFFMKETSVMTVSIFPQPDGIMLVMIVK
jgi:1-aminocyclopropane-1-carboxylate deaminase/D-cysteine desulfhydrase-like pyridoxal-dependent ACC family enzyme